MTIILLGMFICLVSEKLSRMKNTITESSDPDYLRALKYLNEEYPGIINDLR